MNYIRYAYWEKAVKFLRSLFEKMNSSLTSHEVSIMLYWRLFYPQYNSSKEIVKDIFNRAQFLSLDIIDTLQNWFNKTKDDELFQDVYIKAGVFEPSRNNWENVLKRLKRIFNYFPSLINWKINNQAVARLMKSYPAHEFVKNSSKVDDTNILKEQFIKSWSLSSCELSYSPNWNSLEAVNLWIKQTHIDQSTWHFGSQLLIVSAGSGVYRVCPDIALPTRRRILQNGVMVRIVSLTKPPKNSNEK